MLIQNELRRNCYIVGPIYDSILFSFTPVLSLVIGWMMSHPLFQRHVHLVDRREPFYWMFYITLTQSHLIVTVARTHANRSVFQKYWLRFTTWGVCFHHALRVGSGGCIRLDDILGRISLIHADVRARSHLRIQC